MDHRYSSPVTVTHVTIEEYAAESTAPDFFQVSKLQVDFPPLGYI